MYKTGKVIAQLFGVYELVGLSRWEAISSHMKKAFGFPKAFAFTMVEQKLLTANTIYVNSVEIKLTRSWLAVITFCESPDNKS